RIAEHFQVTVLYYNPNIDDEGEYEKRKAEQIRFLQQTGLADILDCAHEKEKFEEMSAGLEKEPERGKRCYLCYELRLKKTAEVAKERGYDYFCTTLTLSPHKNAEWLNEIGYRLEAEVGIKYLPSDFKKRGGYLRSLELSEEYGLYRQSFCGCKYSKR
ncbi:MAG: epoxyqueuosine reductase QueH, partial [Clostridia bacterium]|nr:epoxyqueuosine reductase QueH [Clostridia bacterium]